MDKVRVGVIGVGVLGRHHTRLYKECPEAELVGIYDVDPERARAIAEEFDTTVFPAMEGLLEAVDAASVAVPTQHHHRVVREMIARHKHILVEKPLAKTAAEARELVDAALHAGLVFGVGHVERFNPVLDSLREVPGAPRFIEAERLAPYPPPRPGQPPRGTEVSVVHDLMIHDIDVVLHLVDSPVNRIDAVGVAILSPTADIANARIAFENGCVANLTASRISYLGLRKIRVFKDTAYFSLDYQKQTGEIATLEGREVCRRPVPVREGNALHQELSDFCRCVQAHRQDSDDTTPRVSGEAGLRALELADEIAAQCRAVRPSVVPPA